jgi:hypothetical protein
VSVHETGRIHVGGIHQAHHSDAATEQDGQPKTAVAHQDHAMGTVAREAFRQEDDHSLLAGVRHQPVENRTVPAPIFP